MDQEQADWWQKRKSPKRHKYIRISWFKKVVQISDERNNTYWRHSGLTINLQLITKINLECEI